MSSNMNRFFLENEKKEKIYKKKKGLFLKFHCLYFSIPVGEISQICIKSLKYSL